MGSVTAQGCPGREALCRAAWVVGSAQDPLGDEGGFRSEGDFWGQIRHLQTQDDNKGMFQEALGAQRKD